MKSLSSYIFESVNNIILESRLGKADISKHQYNYVYQLLNYIITEGKTKENTSDEELKELNDKNIQLPFTDIKFGSEKLSHEWFNIEDIKELKNNISKHGFSYKSLQYSNNKTLNFNEMSDEEYDDLINSETFLPDKFHYSLFHALKDKGLESINNILKVSDDKTYFYYKLFNIRSNIGQKKSVKIEDNGNTIKLDDFINKKYKQFINSEENKNIKSVHFISSFNKLHELCQKINDKTLNFNLGLYKVIWTKIDKSSFVPLRIYTADQELGTCVLFNSLKSYKDEITKDVIINILNSKSSDYPRFSNLVKDTNWIKSYVYQLKSIEELIKSNGKDQSVYTMVRFGDKLHDVLNVDYDIPPKVKKFITDYSKSVNSYASQYDIIMGMDDSEYNKNGSNKDNYDPSDVLLIHNDIDELGNYNFKDNGDYGSKTGVEGFKKKLCELCKDGKYFGISLKQLSNKGKIETYNLIDENVSLSNIELENIGSTNNPLYYNDAKDGGGNSISLYFTGKITKGDDTLINNDPDKPKNAEELSINRYKLSLRTFGRYIGIDIALSDHGKSGKISLGKSSKTVWCDGVFNELNKYLGEDNLILFNKYKKDLSLSEHSSKLSYINKDLDPSNKNKIDYFKYLFKVFVNEKNNWKNIFKNINNPIVYIANSALKFGPRCLPYTIIH
jgi:hypothetical protein